MQDHVYIWYILHPLYRHAYMHAQFASGLLIMTFALFLGPLVSTQIAFAHILYTRTRKHRARNSLHSLTYCTSYTLALKRNARIICEWIANQVTRNARTRAHTNTHTLTPSRVYVVVVTGVCFFKLIYIHTRTTYQMAMR